MATVLTIMLSFPSVVFTVLLGVVLVYWLFVLTGALHVDLLGEGAADGALEGAGIEGVAKGALEGAAKGALEGVAKGALEGVAHGSGEGAADGALDAHGDGLAGMLAALKLRSAPATVVLSLIITFSWLFSVLGVQVAAAWLPATIAHIASFALLLLAPLLALPVTSILVRPLGRFFLPPKSAQHNQLVGKTCVIRTGEVTKSFGEATVEDGGAGLVVRVRVDGPAEELHRGDEALIIDYDEAKAEFTVVPMDELRARERQSR